MESYLFPSVVEDGVWRITVDPYVTKSHYSTASISVTSSAELISPAIGYDSGLFDHVRIRFRTVHDRPTVGSFSLAWTNEHNFDGMEGSKGLALQQKRTGGRVEAAVLYDARLFRGSPVEMHDLNADGAEDWVFIGGDRASGFGVFVEWGGSVRPTQAGERHRLEGRATTVLSGDMDGDGDFDLVALDPILGGVHVLKSSLSEQATAVLTTAAVQPAQYRLGDSYPNPFNPSVVIPLDLATDAARVSVRYVGSSGAAGVGRTAGGGYASLYLGRTRRSGQGGGRRSVCL